MNDLKVFQNTEFGELGVMLIDGKEWFPATQCAKLLGYTNPRKAILDHCKGVTKRDALTDGGVQGINYIPEGDLYRLIISSKLPAAERFEKWVFEEVLPSIRKTGSYGHPNNSELINMITASVTTVVTAAMSEMMRNITAMFPKIQLPQINNIMNVPTRNLTKETRKPNKRVSTISKLSPAIQNRVTDMCFSDRHTYVEIQRYLNSLGISISTSALCNYRKYILQCDARQEELKQRAEQ